MFTAEQVMEEVAKRLNEDGCLGNLTDKQVLRLRGLHLVTTSSIGSRFEKFVDVTRYDEDNGIHDILEAHCVYSDPKNLNVPSGIQWYKQSVITFYDHDDVKNILVVASDEDHFQKTQWCFHFKRVQEACVTLMDVEVGDTALTAFVGPADEAIEFAKRMDPELAPFSKAEWMSFAGASMMPDGSDPLYGEAGNLVIIVSRYDY